MLYISTAFSSVLHLGYYYYFVSHTSVVQRKFWSMILWVSHLIECYLIIGEKIDISKGEEEVYVEGECCPKCVPISGIWLFVMFAYVLQNMTLLFFKLKVHTLYQVHII